MSCWASGAVPWRSPTGYVGLTMILWSPAEQEFLSCSDARPEGQRGFDARARYKASGPWAGLGAPAMTTGRRVQLSAPQINAAGRLSGSDKTSASVLPQQSAADFVAALKPLSSWPEALQARTATRLSLLATPQPMKDWMVLRPQRFAAARFDAARQVLVWPLFDAEDNRLDAELAYDEYTAHAIARIEALESSSDGTLLVARLHPGLNSLVAEPLSLVRPNATGNSNVVDALHFDAAPNPGVFSRLLDRLRSGQLGGHATGSCTPSGSRFFHRNTVKNCAGVPSGASARELATATWRASGRRKQPTADSRRSNRSPSRTQRRPAPCCGPTMSGCSTSGCWGCRKKRRDGRPSIGLGAQQLQLTAFPSASPTAW